MTRRLYNNLTAYSRDILWAAGNASSLSGFTRLVADFTAHRLLGLSIGGKTGKTRNVKLRCGKTLVYRKDRCDIWAIHEVWVDKQYQLRLAAPPRTIMDVGANIGLASLWFSSQYRDADILAVEAEPTNALMARTQFAENGISGIVMDVAAGSQNGFATFAKCAGATDGRLIEHPNSSEEPEQGRVLQVPVVTMDSLMSRWGETAIIDLVKMDIEGGEDALITDSSSWLHRVRALVIEFHPLITNYPRMLEVLADKGFSCVSKEMSAETTIEVFVAARG